MAGKKIPLEDFLVGWHGSHGLLGAEGEAEKPTARDTPGSASVCGLRSILGCCFLMDGGRKWERIFQNLDFFWDLLFYRIFGIKVWVRWL